MKLLLWLLVNIFISNNVAVCINHKLDSNNKEFTKVLKKSNSGYDFYFQKDKKSLTINYSYGAFYDTTIYFYYTWPFDIETSPIDFKKILVINPNDCYTKTSWGASYSYYGEPLSKKIADLDYNQVVHNHKADSKDKIKEFANIKLLDITDYYNRTCYIVAKQYVGFGWYFDNVSHKFFFQIYGYFFTQILGSLVGGAHWLNVGSGLYIY